MPEFVMLVGLPGSGKSTSIKKLISTGTTTVLSSDAIRKELWGDESIQGNPAEVFDLMKKRAVDALKNGSNVIYDATNLTRKDRHSILSQLPKGTRNICYIIWARVETCILRDAQRLRTVGKDVIMRMLKRFQTPWYDEGFGKIEIINTDITGYDYDLDFAERLAVPHDTPHHPGLISDHIRRVRAELDRLAAEGINVDYELFCDVVQYHDVGKVFTKTFVNSKGETTNIAHYYDHQNVGAYLALGLPSTINNALLTSWLVNLHMEPFFQESKYYKNLDSEWKKRIEFFHKLDILGA